MSRPYSLVGPEDLVCDLAEEDLLVRLQVRRRSLPNEGFPVEERHLWAPFHRQHFEKRRETESHERTRRAEPDRTLAAWSRSPEPEEPGTGVTEWSGSFVTAAVNLPTWSRGASPSLRSALRRLLSVLLPPTTVRTRRGAASGVLTEFWTDGGIIGGSK